MAPITLRVRSQIGTWRVANVSLTDDFRQLRERLEKEHDAYFERQRDSFSTDPAGAKLLRDDLTVLEAGLKNGDIIYTSIDEQYTSAHAAHSGRKTITKDGRIVQQAANQSIQTAGFRPGMLPLRSMKMHWTLNEFMALDEQFVYKIKAQEKSHCSTATLNTAPLQNFQDYAKQFDFRTIRLGFLYGRFGDNNAVTVECIYEPPQESTDTSFTLLDDPQAESLDKITTMLGLRKVGWIFAHPPREKGFFFSGAEILFTAEQQLEAAGGVEDTPFVTVKLTLDENNQVVVEAFQVSKQCMEMVAEGALEISSHLGTLKVNSTFTAMVEGKESKEVDNTFFLVTTPIQQFDSQFMVCSFPHSNRIEEATRDDLKKQLSKAGKQGWSFTDMISDLELLLFVSHFLSLQDDLPQLCQCVVDRELPMNEGYELLLKSIAGII